jgi:hypothetical protein
MDDDDPGDDHANEAMETDKLQDNAADNYKSKTIRNPSMMVPIFLQL